MVGLVVAIFENRRDLVEDLGVQVEVVWVWACRLQSEQQDGKNCLAKYFFVKKPAGGHRWQR